FDFLLFPFYFLLSPLRQRLVDGRLEYLKRIGAANDRQDLDVIVRRILLINQADHKRGGRLNAKAAGLRDTRAHSGLSLAARQAFFELCHIQSNGFRLRSEVTTTDYALIRNHSSVQ